MPYASGLSCNLDPLLITVLSAVPGCMCAAFLPLMRASRGDLACLSGAVRVLRYCSGESGRPSAQLAARQLASHETRIRLLMCEELHATRRGAV